VRATATINLRYSTAVYWLHGDLNCNTFAYRAPASAGTRFEFVLPVDIQLSKNSILERTANSLKRITRSRCVAALVQRRGNFT
jgi:hypothetical protein